MPKTVIKDTLLLENGQKLHSPTLDWWSSDRLDSGKPIVWILHALTGNQRPDKWWSEVVGYQKVLDTERFNIFCVNCLGSAYGSASPASFHYLGQSNLDFPLFTVRDQANAFAALAETLGIQKVQTLLGASIGGQQALELSLLLPVQPDYLVLISTNAIHSPWGIAFNEAQRMAIESDHAGSGNRGLEVARAIAMLSYRTADRFNESQPRKNNETEQFQASSYQRYQGAKLASRFDAKCYWYLTHAMDSHDLGRGRESIENALSQITSQCLVIGVEGDLLFPFKEQERLHRYLPNSTLIKIKSSFGHDTFLAQPKSIAEKLKDFLNHEIMWKASTINTEIAV